MEMIDDEPDLSIYDFNSIINYIKNNFVQLLLLVFVFFIIYIVDYISNINAIIMSPISMMPVIPQQQLQKIKIPKGRKTSKK
jgi:dolichyl-phosphate-mannose--protein O-mannosyl transferase